jgi:hypothetical protein
MGFCTGAAARGEPSSILDAVAWWAYQTAWANSSSRSKLMNRADLSWALSAVLPHAGRPPRPSFVGIEHHENHLYVYSTDRYTLGIARIERNGDLMRHSAAS